MHGRVPFALRIPSESNLVRVTEQSVKDGVRQGGIPNGLVLVVNQELTGDKSRASPMPVFQEFKYIASVLITEGRQPPVIKNPKAVLAREAMSFACHPSPLVMGSSWSRRSNCKYRTVYPSRQARWPKAHASQVCRCRWDP